MGFMDLFRRQAPQAVPAPVAPDQQAVLVHIPGSDLPAEVYEQCDLATIEDLLMAAIEADNLGELDGNDMGPEGATLYMYSSDAERLFAGIEPILRDYPLTQTAAVVIRKGGPGAPERVVQLPGA